MSDYTHLSAGNLTVLEVLMERRLDGELLENLLDLFSYEGQRNQLFERQRKATAECDRRYCDCGFCAPRMQEPLLYLVVDEIKKYFGEEPKVPEPISDIPF